MNYTRPQIHTTWKSNWLIEFSAAFIILGILTREPLLALIGITVSLTMTMLGLRFKRNVTSIQGGLRLESQLERNRVTLGEMVEGKLTVLNKSSTRAYVYMIRPTLDEDLNLQFHGHVNDLIQPGVKTDFPFTIIPLRRGRSHVTCFSVILADLRYLFTADVRFEQPVWLEAVPGTGERLTPLTLYSGGADRRRRISMGVDYAGTREYTMGDEYNRVEWKATARLRNLMVKEFHPETRTNLQILIDTGRTMQEQSYIGTRLDEALAVAQLIIEATVDLEKSVSIYFYDEKGLVESLKSTAGEEQLDALAEFASKWPRTVVEGGKGVDSATWFSNASWYARYLQPKSDQVVTYFRSLNRILRKEYRNTGIYKAIREAAITPDSILVILTDLEGNIDALLEAASTHQERGVKIIVAQIGATWRLNTGLEAAYAEYRRNTNTLTRIKARGLRVIDTRPDQLLETIVNPLSKAS